MDYKEESTRLAGHKETRGCMTGCDYMDTHCVRTGEDVYSCILTRRENSRRNKDGRMVVRDILFHTSAAAISRRNTYAFSGGRDLFHLVEQNIFHLPREEPLGRQITSPQNKVLVLKPERRMSTQLTMKRVGP